MSIKSDKWIREMAEFGMITPFEPYQVRHSKDNIDNSNKIISYGTSSYGYDVRCANEFKIFTNYPLLIKKWELDIFIKH